MRIFNFLLFFILSYSSLRAQEFATIYVYREKKLSATGVDFKIYFNKLEIALIPNGGRLEYRYYKEGRVNIMCGVFSEYLPQGDNYDNSLALDIKKGQSYYLKGEGKELRLVENQQGKAEFERSSNFKGVIIFNDNKPINYSQSASTEEKEEPVVSITNSPAEIVLTSPKYGNEEEFKTSLENLKISGYVMSSTDIKIVKINGSIVTSDKNGNFSSQVNLRTGLNKVNIYVEDVKKKSAEKNLIIIRELKEELAVTEDKREDENLYRGSDPFKGTNIANASKDIKTGKFYALFIGIDTYSGSWTPLKNAVNDAKAVESLLKEKYQFDVFKSLYNTQATRTGIIKEFEWLVANVKENDNVLIYYSGHGEFKKELNKGYWVPVDAKTTSTSYFISNSEIQTFLAGIPSKHTLLISDACFSGDIFRGTTSSMPFENTEKYYSNAYGARSRQAISSGGIEPVMDGGRDGHSVFAYYLIQALKNNNSKYFDSSQLFGKIKIPVSNNSDQSPNFNPINKAGDEGGHFLFIRKN